MTRIKSAIIKTICYADVFDYPLTESEIWRFIIGHRLTLIDFRKALQYLVKQKIIIYRDRYYAFRHRSNIIKIRYRRKKSSSSKLKIALHAASLLKFFPTIWFVGISGALAMNNAPINDDVDIFIISAPRTMWLTRLLTTVFLDALRLRRKPGNTNNTNKICLNMYMDAQKLTLPRNEQDLYSAHEVVQLKPLINKRFTYERFLNSNKWVKRYLPHAYINTKVPINKIRFGWEKHLSVFEEISKKWQINYMQKRKTKEVVNDEIIRFHPVDARAQTLYKYQRLCNKFRA